jgi:hypothetical protein
MNNNSFLKSLLFALTVVLFASCDNDFNALGTDIVGIDNFDLEPETLSVNLTNQYIGAVASKNQPINPLGIYDNPVFGVTKANFVTQVQLATENPIFNTDLAPEIYSVVLYVPLFSTQTVAPTATELGQYTLDSIYGPKPYAPISKPFSKFKLSVHESNYFIRDINPVDQLTQSYYTDNTDFTGSNIGEQLNIYGAGVDQTQNDQFVFSEREYLDIDSTKVSSTANTVVKRGPALKLDLKKQFFIDKILHAPAGKLLNNNVFKDYFRGLYFKVEQIGGSQGNMAMLNFAQGKIVIHYKQYTTASDHSLVQRRLVLNLTGNSISLIDQGTPPVTPSPTDIVLKGGANNSMAIVDLIGTKAEVDALRERKMLINDASLTFKIKRGADAMDRTNVDGMKAAEPLRLYLYDLNNKRYIADYSIDQTTNSTKSKFGKIVYGGIIKRESTTEKRGVSYKIKITSHLINLLQNDTITNVRLGLVVTEDINTTTNVKIKNQAGNIKVIPGMSAIHPLGTILYGSNDPDPENRPKFQIYYTKPKQQ